MFGRAHEERGKGEEGCDASGGGRGELNEKK